MNAADSAHSLAPDIALLAPASFTIKSTAQALAGTEKDTGVLLSILLKASPAGAVAADRLAESALGLLQKKYPAIDRSAAAQPVSGRGWSGRTQLLQAGRETPLQIVLTTLISPDPINPAQQRNLIMLIEVPQAQFASESDFYSGFAAQRLLIGNPDPPPTESLVFELAAIETADQAAAVVVQTAPSASRAAPVPVFSSTFELVPIEAAEQPVAIDSAALTLLAAQAKEETSPPASAPILTTNFELVPLEVPEPPAEQAAAARPSAAAVSAAAPSAASSKSPAAARSAAAATSRSAAPRATAGPTEPAEQDASADRRAVPNAERVPEALSGHDRLAMAARGQKVLAYSIALSLIARLIGNVPDMPVLLAYAISAAVLFYAISGVLKICSGFAYTMNRKLVLMFCSSVPLIGIICWIYLSIKITRRLRAAGFEVGLFGVKS